MSSATACSPRPISDSKRRSPDDMAAIRADIYAVLEAENPMTVRQVFYQLVSRGTIAKTENEYKQTVIRLLKEMRLDGEVPFDWIADNTRWMRKPRTFNSVEHALRHTARTYRSAVWNTADAYVECWLEKEALAGVLYDVTELYDVPLMVTRGYASLTYLFEAAKHIEACGKPAHLYYFGDHDPSGKDITRNTEARLREFAPGVEIHFERVAVTQSQIQSLNLPTRPTKKTDSRSKDWSGGSVEVDAITPQTLRGLTRRCIEQHIDPRQLQVTRTTEQSERQFLEMLAARYSTEDES